MRQKGLYDAYKTKQPCINAGLFYKLLIISY